MQDILSRAAQLKRPRLLARAGRIGADDYRRETHLPSVLGTSRLPRSGAAVMKLLEMETTLNEQRLADASDYLLHEHIQVLIALIGETRILRATHLDPNPT